MSSRHAERFTLAAGASRVLAPHGAPFSIAVHPEPGASVTVELTLSPPAEVNAGTARWYPLALGEPLTAAELIVYPAPVTAVRLSTATAGATVEVVS